MYIALLLLNCIIILSILNLAVCIGKCVTLMLSSSHAFRFNIWTYLSFINHEVLAPVKGIGLLNEG